MGQVKFPPSLFRDEAECDGVDETGFLPVGLGVVNQECAQALHEKQGHCDSQ